MKRDRIPEMPMVRRLRRRLTAIFTVLTGLVFVCVLGLSLYVSVQRVRAMQMSNYLTSVTTMASELVMVESAEALDFSTLEKSYGLVTAAAADDEALAVSGDARAWLVEDVLFESYYEALETEDIRWEHGADVDTALGVLITDAFYEEYDIAYFSIAVVQNLPDSEVDGKSEAGDARQAKDSPVKIVPEDETAVVYTISGDNSSVAVAPAAGTAGYTVGLRTNVAVEDEAGNLLDGVTLYILPGDGAEMYGLTVLNDVAGQRRQERVLYTEYGLLLAGGLLLLCVISWFLARLVLRPTVEGLRRQTEFVAAASHELRSPLAVLRASLSAAGAAEAGDEAARYRQAAEGEAERMSRLVDDLLLLAGGDAGRWKLQREDVDLDTLLIETAEHYRPLAWEQGVDLTLYLPEETLGTLRADCDRLQQILRVLLDNALQYAPEGSEIGLGARRRRRTVEITVTDHGPGVPDEVKQKVFERFYRAEASRRDKTHFGLGLSVAKELAELHGGSLTVRDTSGGGATFCLVLPADSRAKEETK